MGGSGKEEGGGEKGGTGGGGEKGGKRAGHTPRTTPPFQRTKMVKARRRDR